MEKQQVFKNVSQSHNTAIRVNMSLKTPKFGLNVTSCTLTKNTLLDKQKHSLDQVGFYYAKHKILSQLNP